MKKQGDGWLDAILISTFVLSILGLAAMYWHLFALP